MPVPASITDLSTTAGGNSPPGSESPATLDDYLRAHAAFIAQLRAVIGGSVDANIPNAVTKQSSVTDATAGRVMIVGAFGLGGAPISFTNANSLPATTGFFGYAGSGSNVPSGGQFGDLLLHQYFNSNAIAQTYTKYATGQTYTRTWLAGVWSSWVEIATSANSLGQGQTWQDLSGSRNPSTTYTNSTGRPIVVFVEGTASGGNTTTISTVGATVGIVTSRHAASGFFVTTPMIVPSGSTYSITPFTGGWASKVWWELR